MRKQAADTNVLIRLLVQDDPAQGARALEALGTGFLVVQPTVLLETEWVLRSVLKYGRDDVRRAFADLFALPNVLIQEEERAIHALDLHARGMDFADALHLLGAAGCDEFLTFDRDLARRAEQADLQAPVRLL